MKILLISNGGRPLPEVRIGVPYIEEIHEFLTKEKWTISGRMRNYEMPDKVMPRFRKYSEREEVDLDSSFEEELEEIKRHHKKSRVRQTFTITTEFHEIDQRPSINVTKKRPHYDQHLSLNDKSSDDSYLTLAKFFSPIIEKSKADEINIAENSEENVKILEEKTEVGQKKKISPVASYICMSPVATPKAKTTSKKKNFRHNFNDSVQLSVTAKAAASLPVGVCVKKASVKEIVKQDSNVEVMVHNYERTSYSKILKQRNNSYDG